MSVISRPLSSRSQPWLDRAGRLSWLKLAIFVALFLPGLWLAVQLATGQLQPKPVTEAIHTTGLWAVRFILISLAITPLRRLTQWNRLLLVRRMLGLAALAYALIHFFLYIVSLQFDLVHVASEIILRIYLTIGFVALLGLAVLGATSTDAMIKRIGAVRWNGLHQIIYAISILALLHFFMQSKLDVSQPALLAGLFVLLMGHRLLARFKLSDTIFALLMLAVVSGLLTALIEAGWYNYARHVPLMRILQANLEFDPIQPGWWVALVGLGLVVFRLARPWLPERKALRKAA